MGDLQLCELDGQSTSGCAAAIDEQWQSAFSRLRWQRQLQRLVESLAHRRSAPRSHQRRRHSEYRG